MADLIYTGIMSLDGYVADVDGSFDWSAPDPEVHAFVNNLQRSIGTYLYGRRMYEVMTAWEDLPVDDEPSYIQDFAQLWRTKEKVVYSTTLTETPTARTRLEPEFDPAAVRRLKAEQDRDLAIAGPTVAACAIRAGLVDEFQLFVTPVIVGGGTPYLPDRVHLDLDLRDERRFGNGVVFLRYRSTA